MALAMETDVGPITRPSAAVAIRDAYKMYPSKIVVFKGLNMTVPKGTIYGLLGPSGCGKTTLLNCLVGRSFLDAGSIHMNVTRRSEIGFMPQTLSLYQNLTVYENFFVFGYIFGISTERIRTRASELIKFLDIPTPNRQLKTFSGGEQRRVSIAITFIHDPKLFILDEPTVGLDPILCQSIWSRFLEMSEKGRTIIITTHYIQEACQAHTIGLMRGGVLLAEDNPTLLLARYNSDDLEDVFLRLSLQQNEQNIEDSNSAKNCQKVKMQFEEDEVIFSPEKFKAANYKNAVVLKRAYVFVLFLFLLPISQTYFFNVSIGRKPKHLKVGVVNDEISVSRCDQDAYKGCFLLENESVSLSCCFLDLMRKETYQFIEYTDLSLAVDHVKQNKIWALLHFKTNYTRSLAEMYSFSLYADPEDIINAFINTWIDLTNQYIGNFIKYDVARLSTFLVKQAFINCGENPKLGAPPLSIEEPIFGSYTEDFISYASSATLCVCCFFLPSLLTGGLVFVEKYGGILERLIISGVSIVDLFASVTVFQVVVHILQLIGMVYITYHVFENPLKGSIITLSALLLIIGISGAFFGLMLAGLNKNTSVIAYIGVGFNLILVMTSGIMWPVEAEHYLLKSVSSFIPLTLAVDATRGICAKNYSVFHPLVLKGFISTVSWGFVFLLIIFIVSKVNKNVWVVQK